MLTIKVNCGELIVANIERRERDREEMRTNILDAARELFAQFGYDEVTMRKVAEKIEYSPTTIYLYFRDKETLIRELCAHDFLELAGKFQRIALVRDPIERLRKIGLAYLHFGLDHPNHYRLMFMTSNPYDDPAEMNLEQGNPSEDAYAFLKMSVQEALQAGCFRVELKDVDLLAQTLWAGMHGVISLHIAKQDDAWVEWSPMKRRADLMIDALIVGLTKPVIM